MRSSTFAAFSILVAVAAPVFANDGFGGLSATGLTFGQTAEVAMVSEDLYIGLDRITVDYVFRNASATDVTGEVIFPLPPISVWGMWEGMINLPEPPYPDNLVGFSALVDGQPVEVEIDRIAVIEPEWVDDRPMNEQYDTPGRDVTAELQRFGLPLTLDIEQVIQILTSLPPETRAELTEAGLAVYYEGDAAAGIPEEGFPTWSIIYRYHWTQTFPAGAEVRIRHEYENRPPGGVFYWEHPATEDYLDYYVDRFCIDNGTSAAMAKALRYQDPSGEVYNHGTAYFLSYVLRTANSWAGPIGQFRLTLDKGNPGNVISLCVDGIRKTGPTTFVVEKENYTPDRDLDILVVEGIRD